MTEEEYQKVEQQRVEKIAEDGRSKQATVTPQVEDVPQPQPQPQPQSVAKLSSVKVLFDKSMEVYKANFWKMIGMLMLPLVGLVALAIVVMLFGYLSMSLNSMHSPGVITVVKIVLSVLGILSLVGMIYLGVVVRGGLYILVRDASRKLSFKQAFHEGKKFAIGLLVINLISGIFIMLWGLLFIIPGFIAAIYYTLANWVYVYEGFTGTNALKRSKELIDGYWWAVFGRFMAIVGAYYLIIILGQLLVVTTGYSADIIAVVVNILSIVIGPFIVIYTCFIYWDLKKIKGESKIENKKGGGLGIIVLFFIIIIAIVSFYTMSIVNLRDAKGNARDSMRVTRVNSIRTGIEMYIADNDQPPAAGNKWRYLNDDLGQYIQGGLPSDPSPSRSICYCAKGDDYIVAAITTTDKKFSGDIDTSIVTESVSDIYDPKVDCICSEDSKIITLDCSDNGSGVLETSKSLTVGSVYCLGTSQ